MEATRDPRILFGKAGITLRSSEEMLGVDLDKASGYETGRLPRDLPSGASATNHHGGGPNVAGEDIEEPELTWAQKVAITLGRVKRVLRGWDRYHRSRGMAAIAYGFWVGRFGRVAGVLRGWRQNGGQWGRINSNTVPIVFVLGLGQKVSAGGWRMFAALWFAMGAPDTPEDQFVQIRGGGFPGGVRGHRHWNYHPETKSRTSCPGDERATYLLQRRHEEALPLLWAGMGRRKRRYVKLWTARLVELGYLDRVYTRFRPAVVEATRDAQWGNGRPATGVVRAADWKVVGKLAAVRREIR